LDIVFALAGDSTITSCLPCPHQILFSSGKSEAFFVDLATTVAVGFFIATVFFLLGVFGVLFLGVLGADEETIILCRRQDKNNTHIVNYHIYRLLFSYQGENMTLPVDLILHSYSRIAIYYNNHCFILCM